MKRLSIFIMFVITMLMAQSCVFEKLTIEYEPREPIRIDIKTAVSKLPTKAGADISENEIDDLYMLVYDASGKFLKYKKAVSLVDKDPAGRTKTATFSMDTEETLENVRLRFYANMDGNVTGFASQIASLVKGSSTIDDIDASFDSRSAESIPMLGRLANGGGTFDTPVDVLPGTNPTYYVEMVRMMARINVMVTPSSTLGIESIRVYDTAVSDEPLLYQFSAPYSAQALNKIYIGETANTDAHPFFLIIGVNDGVSTKYSRIDFVQDDGHGNKSRFDIVRNTSYQVSLDFPGALTGYTTYEKAIAYGSENIDVTFTTVEDTYHNVMVTDEVYLLCLSGDEFTVPLAGGTFDFVVFTTLPHTAEIPYSWYISKPDYIDIYKEHDPSIPTYSGQEMFNYYLTGEVESSTVARDLVFDVCATDKIKWTVTVHQHD